MIIQYSIPTEMLILSFWKELFRVCFLKSSIPYEAKLNNEDHISDSLVCGYYIAFAKEWDHICCKPFWKTVSLH